jgi:hypothetical protein
MEAFTREDIVADIQQEMAGFSMSATLSATLLLRLNA